MKSEDVWTVGDPFQGSLVVKEKTGEDLETEDSSSRLEDPLSKILPTNVAGEKPSPITVKYEKRAAKKRKVTDVGAGGGIGNSSAKKLAKEVTLGNALHDIRKLNVKSATGNDKLAARAELVVRLGAKPPKNKGVNYKHLKETKKNEKEKMLEQKKLDIVQNNSLNKKNRKGRKKR